MTTKSNHPSGRACFPSGSRSPRQVTPTSAPFEWNGQNYLIKMLQDCDFLDQVESLRTWLGFRVSGNPFFFPRQGNIDEDPDTDSNERPSNDAAKGLKFDKIGVADVGRQPWLGPLEVDDNQESDGVLEDKGNNRSKRRKLRKTGPVNTLGAYASAVVNDLTLIPAVKTPSSTRPGGPEPAGVSDGSRTDALGFPPKSATVDIDGLVPNLVSKEDAQRIGVAAQVLKEEERRVLEATTAAGRVDRSSRSRQRSRLSSIFSDAGGRNRRTSRAPSILWDAPSTIPLGDVQGHPSTVPLSPSKRRISKFGERFSSRKASAAGTLGLDSRVASAPLETEEKRYIVLTTAGLQQQPPPDPHPGLGPVLLRSDRPGGELHPLPFIHTVSDAHSANTDDLELKIEVITPNMSDQKTLDRCSTAPSTVTSRATNDSARRFTLRKAPRRSSVNQRRVSTAPANLFRTPQPRGTSLSAQGLPPPSHVSDQEGFLPSTEGVVMRQEEASARSRSSYSSRGVGLCRKAGAELRALTAAGTTGRRQPPPRELRLRRLARDVARHSAELRRLVREEDRLRKSLARLFSSDGRPKQNAEIHEPGIDDAEAVTEDDAVARMVAVRHNDGANRRISFDTVNLAASSEFPEKIIKHRLGAKQREIELKTFDLGIKRDELGCLRIVQKQERERKLALEMERRRAHLDEGQVRSLLMESTCHLHTLSTFATANLQDAYYDLCTHATTPLFMSPNHQSRRRTFSLYV